MYNGRVVCLRGRCCASKLRVIESDRQEGLDSSECDAASRTVVDERNSSGVKCWYYVGAVEAASEGAYWSKGNGYVSQTGRIGWRTKCKIVTQLRRFLFPTYHRIKIGGARHPRPKGSRAPRWADLGTTDGQRWTGHCLLLRHRNKRCWTKEADRSALLLPAFYFQLSTCAGYCLPLPTRCTCSPPMQLMDASCKTVAAPSGTNCCSYRCGASRFGGLKGAACCIQCDAATRHLCVVCGSEPWTCG